MPQNICLINRSPRPGVLLTLGRIASFPASAPLYPEEDNLTGDMLPGRRREFAAGRYIARQALRQLGAAEKAILMGDEGEPLWDEEITGSICHTHSDVGALVAWKSVYRSVGLDIDDGREIGDAAAIDIVLPKEVDLLMQLKVAACRKVALRMLFSIKEALYKCQFPVTGCSDLGFLDICLSSYDATNHEFRARAAGDSTELQVVIANIRLFLFEVQGITMACALSPV